MLRSLLGNRFISRRRTISLEVKHVKTIDNFQLVLARKVGSQDCRTFVSNVHGPASHLGIRAESDDATENRSRINALNTWDKCSTMDDVCCIVLDKSIRAATCTVQRVLWGTVMTKTEWLSCACVRRMLKFLRYAPADPGRAKRGGTV